MRTRRCTRCTAEKPWDEFYLIKNKRGERVPKARCKQCESEERKEKYPEKREQILARNRRWREANLDKARMREMEYRRTKQRHLTLRSTHSISLDEYNAMLERQGGLCALCRRPSDKALQVDHDRTHCPTKRSCGKCIRGLLCAPCNRSLAWLGDRPARLEDALNYVSVNDWEQWSQMFAAPVDNVIELKEKMG